MRRINSLKYLFILLLSSVILIAEENTPLLKSGDLENLKILREKVFDGNSLWGHINGGADLYLEYGFDKLTFQEVSFNDIIYRVELYKMSDAESAFGIFSIRQYNCQITKSITDYMCVTGNQIQAAIVSFYISISNESETEKALNNSFELFDVISSRVDENSFAIPETFLRINDLYPKSDIKLIKGVLGLQNGFPLWESYFESLENYRLLMITVEDNKGFVNLAEIFFDDNNSSVKFVGQFTKEPLKKGEVFAGSVDDIFIQLKKLSGNKILFMESDYSVQMNDFIEE